MNIIECRRKQKFREKKRTETHHTEIQKNTNRSKEKKIMANYYWLHMMLALSSQHHNWAIKLPDNEKCNREEIK